MGTETALTPFRFLLSKADQSSSSRSLGWIAQSATIIAPMHNIASNNNWLISLSTMTIPVR
jgi:hypothetical protein